MSEKQKYFVYATKACISALKYDKTISKIAMAEEYSLSEEKEFWNRFKKVIALESEAVDLCVAKDDKDFELHPCFDIEKNGSWTVQQITECIKSIKTNTEIKVVYNENESFIIKTDYAYERCVLYIDAFGNKINDKSSEKKPAEINDKNRNPIFLYYEKKQKKEKTI